jgi:uncharacterized protein involved in exopolysaccharide biosynthesis
MSRRKFLLAGFAAAGAIVGIALTFLQTPVYRAHTSIEIQDLNNDFLNIKYVSPVADPSSADTLTDIQTQIKILRICLPCEITA